MTRVVTLTLVFLLLGSSANGQDSSSVALQLSDSAVRAALDLGTSTKKGLGLALGPARSDFIAGLCRGTAHDDECAFGVTAQGPFGRIASAAADAAKKYISFTPDSVTTALRSPLILVVANPIPPSMDRVLGLRKSPHATHAVLQTRVSKGENRVTIQPTHVETFPVSWTNVLGGEVAGQGLRAYFDPTTIPLGDFEIVIITDQKESRYGVGKKDREKLK